MRAGCASAVSPCAPRIMAFPPSRRDSIAMTVSPLDECYLMTTKISRFVNEGNIIGTSAR